MATLSTTTLLAILLALLYYLHRRLTASKHLLDHLPWIGLNEDEWFAKSRAHLREATSSWDLLKAGYAKWSTQERTFIIPNLTFRPEAILAQSHISWLVKQPEGILSTKPAQVSLLELEWLAPAQIYEHPFHEEVIRKDLTRHLGQLTPAIVDAVMTNIDRIWGEESEWREVNAHKTLSEIIIKISNSIFLGDAIGPDEKYVKAVTNFSQVFVLSAAAIKALLPDILKPVLAPALGLPSKYFLKKCKDFLVPVIEQRLAALQRQRDYPDIKQDVPSDFIQWMTQAAFLHDSPAEADATLIATRILLMETTAIHTSASAITNTVIDLVASDPSLDYLNGIREQASKVLVSTSGQWTHLAIRQLTRADSAIRESLRYSGFAARGAKRQVTAPGGLTLPDGAYLPCGAWLSIPVAAIHHDDRFYPSPTTYDAFRFSDARADMLEALRMRGAGGQAELWELLQEKRLSLSTTSDAFVPFGHGRHSCPGRFFAAQVLKLILAHITLKYDIQPLQKRPSNVYMSDFCAPPQKAILTIRRKVRGENDALD
ncbi:uncharacterized protein K452DRAFT_300184 [Aplosporella prunicola CBS 121167]|uniref:Cytochrome P450 n=1 Tax=Aplosporella prunicola CBS 121167 TaxID=1176127 RepID=A0A6A6B8G2_9PEZI|nr:uncharacterized protein K452DRAFT_300184 [Aplosporella prunicola CBS 121167]KAF2139643.1 hypothetical protein K452DRAFT_300184 [Aplosporella prunicola CBS 121167]